MKVLTAVDLRKRLGAGCRRVRERREAGESGIVVVMNEEQARLDEELRKRFPWVGLGSEDEADLSGRYREIMEHARVNQEVVEAIDAVRHSA